MIEEREDTKGKLKFAVRKSHHLTTGKHHSRTLTEFSAAGWNQATMDYLESVQGLGDKRLKAILDDAKSRVKGKNKEFLGTKPKSTRSALHSDSDETNMLAAYDGAQFIPFFK
jgi:DNA uptake protein ComE-like DNA-binding protein